MLLRFLSQAILVAALWTAAGATEKYSGPRPPKPDIPYLQHADNLVETEVAEAKEQTRKDELVYVVPGTASPARTPLAEPIFLIQTEKLDPEKLGLFKLEVKGGSREIAFPQKKKKDSPRSLRLSITRLDEHLYRVEAAEILENGEYSLSPSGSNRVFCFQIH